MKKRKKEFVVYRHINGDKIAILNESNIIKGLIESPDVLNYEMIRAKSSKEALDNAKSL